MKNNKRYHTHPISRRKFIKTGVTLSAASALSFSIPTILFGKTKPASNPIASLDGFTDPYGVAVSPDGLVYVSDAGGYCIKIFDQTGKPVKTFGEAGSSGHKLNYPQGIGIDADGNVHVIDSNNGRIAIFSPDGIFKDSIGEVGGYPDAFYTPKGIFIKDKIYACNTRNHRLSVFDKNTHQLIGSYGDLGDDPEDLPTGSLNYHFRLPTGVAVSEDGKIYVVDSKHGEIKVLAQSGEFQFKFGENGNAEGQLNLPEGITLDSSGNVYVCDSMNGRIQKFNPEGKFIGILNEGLTRPTSICIDDEGKFYVVDAELKQVIIFEWTT
jgi:DNA-binding beta-propeller fold protein YncE